MEDGSGVHMKLDFSTLYVIILLNSLGFALVWALVSWSYRSLHAARYWLTGLIMTCLSGPALVAGGDRPFLLYVGNTLVIASFAVIWQGVRVFYGKAPFWNHVVLIVAASVGAMAAYGTTTAANNIIFAAGQIVCVALAVATLLRAEERHLGAWVAAAAGIVLIVGQGAEASTNALRLMGAMTTEEYYQIGPWFLVFAIIGASVWNLGFLLMTTDRLRAELHALATRDELTGLSNRRALQERIVFCEKSARRKARSVSVLMIDLDRFKTINDGYGHAAGDAALAHIADVAKSNLRDGDFLARVGGDEFCMLLPDTDLAQATSIADGMTKAIANRPLQWRESEIVVSASIGIIEWKPGSAFGLAESLPLADKALFGTKRAGRNGYTVYAAKPALLRVVQ